MSCHYVFDLTTLVNTFVRHCDSRAALFHLQDTHCSCGALHQNSKLPGRADVPITAHPPASASVLAPVFPPFSPRPLNSWTAPEFSPQQSCQFSRSTPWPLFNLLERSSHKFDHFINAGPPAPTGQTLSPGQAPGPANLKQSVRYVPQNRHRPCPSALAHATLVLRTAHVPPVLRSILDR